MVGGSLSLMWDPRRAQASIALGGGVGESSLCLSFSQKLKNVKWDCLSLCVLEALRRMKERLHEALVEKNALTSCPVSHSRDSPQGPPYSPLPVASWLKFPSGRLRAVRGLGDCMHWLLHFR